LKERISHGHRSPADEELYQWFFRGDPMTRSALATNPTIWGDHAFRRKLIALRQACSSDGETRHPFEVPPGHPALLKAVIRAFEGSRPDWLLDIDRLDFHDILRIRQNRDFSRTLHRMSLPLPKLMEEPKLCAFLKSEWKESLLAAATTIDRPRRVIRKVSDAAGEQVVVNLGTVGSSLVTAGVGALAAGSVGTAALAKLDSAPPLLATSPLLISLLLLGVGWRLALRLGSKAKAANNLATGVIGALSEGAGAMCPGA
jgi:hypothetical protein